MSDLQVRLRHFPFFDALSKASDESAIEWRTAKAGLLVLRTVDNWVSAGPEAITENEWGVHVVRRTVRLIDEGHPLRELILTVLDTMRQAPEGDPSDLVPPLTAYARGLEFEAQWTLAADVYDTIISTCASPRRDTPAIVYAQMRLGACCRMLGEWKGAADAYKAAGRLAKLTGDREGVLRSQIAMAKLAMDRGNYPEAEGILDKAITRARREGFEAVCAIALHDRATVAHHRGQFALAIQLGYEALRGTTVQAQRDRVLADLAASFCELGLHDAARDAHAIVAATAEQQLTRWAAQVNLLEIAAIDGNEAVFEQYRRELAKAELPASLAVHYHYYVGEGYRAFGQTELARAALEQAVAIASAHGLNEILIRAEQRLSEIAGCLPIAVVNPSPPSVATTISSSAIADVASAIHRMRTHAGVPG